MVEYIYNPNDANDICNYVPIRSYPLVMEYEFPYTLVELTVDVPVMGIVDRSLAMVNDHELYVLATVNVQQYQESTQNRCMQTFRSRLS